MERKMNVKVKTALIIIVTLVIGIIMGAMINRTLVQKRIRRAFSIRNPRIFVQSYLRTIKPGSDQHETIMEILSKYEKHVSEIRENFNEEVQSSYELMLRELEPILTPEQMKRIEEPLPGGPPPPFFMNHIDREITVLKDKLGLTEEQISQIKLIMENMRKRAEKPPLKRRGFREGREFFRKFSEEREREIEKILTEDQKKIYREIKKGRPMFFKGRIPIPKKDNR